MASITDDPPGTRRRRRLDRLVFVLAGFCLLVLAAAMLRALMVTGPGLPTVGVALDEIAQGLSRHRVGGEHVWIDRSGEQFTVLRNAANHLPGERLDYCPGEDLFWSPMHGELFDRQGRAISGPATRGLDQLSASVQVVDGVARLVVDTSDPTLGGPPVAWEDRHLYLDRDLVNRYDAAGGFGFCTN